MLARRDALARLRRPWFSGGTIRAVRVQGDWHRSMDDESAFEDGTLNFLSIPDVEFGLRWLDSIGVDLVHSRVSLLTDWLLGHLTALRHRTGQPLARVYGPSTGEGRGATVTFNVLRPDGAPVDERLVAGKPPRPVSPCVPGASAIRARARVRSGSPGRRCGDVCSPRSARSTSTSTRCGCRPAARSASRSVWRPRRPMPNASSPSWSRPTWAGTALPDRRCRPGYGADTPTG
ncbi:aminotransferase class V-fold PLP-dependent enzyme [Micromonospora sp. DT4]|uniref:aminotransferase class V-fold PLP-dependent enzyme n=1 Tax=Micromonospora sp. DT4 TaxID=3393438 RepID=UPI003CFA08BE